jgi:hypothetical protein
MDPQLIYIAVFERPANPVGLAWINEATNGGSEIWGNLIDLTSTSEYQGRFIDKNASEIVASFYESLFNRAPEAGGLEYWTSHLVPSTAGGWGNGWTITEMPFVMAQAAQNEDILTLQAKADVSNYFTNVVLDTPIDVGYYNGEDAIAWGQKFLNDVDWQYVPTNEAIEATWEAYLIKNAYSTTGEV